MMLKTMAPSPSQHQRGQQPAATAASSSSSGQLRLVPAAADTDTTSKPQVESTTNPTTSSSPALSSSVSTASSCASSPANSNSKHSGQPASASASNCKTTSTKSIPLASNAGAYSKTGSHCKPATATATNNHNQQATISNHNNHQSQQQHFHGSSSHQQSQRYNQHNFHHNNSAIYPGHRSNQRNNHNQNHHHSHQHQPQHHQHQNNNNHHHHHHHHQHPLASDQAQFSTTSAPATDESSTVIIANGPASNQRRQQPPTQMSGPPHYVDLHVNAGECVSLQLLDGQERIVAGPATITMISQQQNPPVPIPVQVPPGHMIHQIADENGTLKHIILSVMGPAGDDGSQLANSTVINLPQGSFRIDSNGELVNVSNGVAASDSQDLTQQPGNVYFADYDGCPIGYDATTMPTDVEPTIEVGELHDAQRKAKPSGKNSNNPRDRSPSVVSSKPDSVVLMSTVASPPKELPNQENPNPVGGVVAQPAAGAATLEAEQMVVPSSISDTTYNPAAALGGDLSTLMSQQQPQQPHQMLQPPHSAPDVVDGGQLYGYPACCCCCFCDPQDPAVAAAASQQPASGQADVLVVQDHATSGPLIGAAMGQPASRLTGRGSSSHHTNIAAYAPLMQTVPMGAQAAGSPASIQNGIPLQQGGHVEASGKSLSHHGKGGRGAYKQHKSPASDRHHQGYGNHHGAYQQQAAFNGGNHYHQQAGDMPPLVPNAASYQKPASGYMGPAYATSGAYASGGLPITTLAAVVSGDKSSQQTPAFRGMNLDSSESYMQRIRDQQQQAGYGAKRTALLDKGPNRYLAAAAGAGANRPVTHRGPAQQAAAAVSPVRARARHHNQNGIRASQSSFSNDKSPALHEQAPNAAGSISEQPSIYNSAYPQQHQSAYQQSTKANKNVYSQQQQVEAAPTSTSSPKTKHITPSAVTANNQQQHQAHNNNNQKTCQSTERIPSDGQKKQTDATQKSANQTREPSSKKQSSNLVEGVKLNNTDDNDKDKPAAETARSSRAKQKKCQTNANQAPNKQDINNERSPSATSRQQSSDKLQMNNIKSSDAKTPVKLKANSQKQRVTNKQPIEPLKDEFTETTFEPSELDRERISPTKSVGSGSNNNSRLSRSLSKSLSFSSDQATREQDNELRVVKQPNKQKSSQSPASPKKDAKLEVLECRQQRDMTSSLAQDEYDDDNDDDDVLVVSSSSSGLINDKLHPTISVTMRTSFSENNIQSLESPLNSSAKSTQTTPQKLTTANLIDTKVNQQLGSKSSLSTGDTMTTIKKKAERRKSSNVRNEQPVKLSSMPQLRMLNLNCTSATPNSVNLRWSYVPSLADKYGIPQLGSRHHFLLDHFVVESSCSKSADTSALVSPKIVYQGCAMTCRVSHLSPEKIYHFKVRRTALVTVKNDDEASASGEHLVVSEILSVTLPSLQQQAKEPAKKSLVGKSGSRHDAPLVELTRSDSSSNRGNSSSQSSNSNHSNNHHHNHHKSVVHHIKFSSLVRQCRNRFVSMIGRLVQSSISGCSDTKFAGFLLVLFTILAMLLAVFIHVYIVTPVTE